MDVVLLVLVCLLGLILAQPVLKRQNSFRRISYYIDRLPGDRWYPLVGSVAQLLRAKRQDLFQVLADRHRRLGPIFRSWYGSLPMVHIYKPEHVEVIFKSNTITSKGLFYRFFMMWLGQGLISGSGPRWRAHRKIITPSFHFKILDSYGEIFAEKGACLVNYLRKFEGKGFVEITEDLTKIGLDVITETAMGVRLGFLEGSSAEGLEYAKAIINFSRIAYRRCVNPLYGNDFLFHCTALGRESERCSKLIGSFNRRIIQTRKKQLEAQSPTVEAEKDELGRRIKVSFLDMLLNYQRSNPFADEEIEEEVSTFMFGGFDTTSATLSYAFAALGNHPECLKKVQAELDEIFTENPSRKVTPQDVARMEYLDRVVKEVLRFFCFVPYIFRQLDEDIELDGFTIPTGTNLSICLYNLHHDPHHYPEPFRFDPDRFLPENCSKRHPYAYVPFSAGARNCLGQKFAMRNIKTLLACVLRKYNVKCLERVEDIKYTIEIVLRPLNGLHVALERRT
uniref:Cytochrome P450 n=2 Tax=Dendroctonus ponderosae TaxID=77166 RepID=A0AAR5PE84_DENPD